MASFYAVHHLGKGVNNNNYAICVTGFAKTSYNSTFRNMHLNNSVWEGNCLPNISAYLAIQDTSVE